jgi:hypothetical protein
MLEIIAPNWQDWIGYLAALFIVLGMSQKDLVKVRCFMVCGSITFVTYGILVAAYPVVIANFLIGSVTSKYLYCDLMRLKKKPR